MSVEGLSAIVKRDGITIADLCREVKVRDLCEDYKACFGASDMLVHNELRRRCDDLVRGLEATGDAFNR